MAGAASLSDPGRRLPRRSCRRLSSYARSTAPEYLIKAAYLYNFAMFVDGLRTPSRPDSPIVIGIVGTDPFGSALDDTVRANESTAAGRRQAARSRNQDLAAVSHLFRQRRWRPNRRTIVRRDKRPCPADCGRDRGSREARRRHQFPDRGQPGPFRHQPRRRETERALTISSQAAECRQDRPQRRADAPRPHRRGECDS